MEVTLTHPPLEDQEFRQLADSMPVMIWRADTTMAFDFFNHAWLHFTGRRREQELGTGWTEGVHPDDLTRCLACYHDAFAERRDFSVQYRLRDRHGRWRWMLDTGRSYENERGFGGFLGSCVDVTEMVEAIEARRRADAERELLMAELEHRVKNNAQATTSYLAMQANRAEDPAVASALRGAATRVLLAALVQDRMFRAGDEGQVELGAELKAAARNAVEVAGRPGVHLDVTLESEFRLPVAQAAPLALIVNELVVNAARHAFPGGRPGLIRLCLRRVGPATGEIVVSDNGVGLTPDRSAGDARQGPLGLHLMPRLARQGRASLQVDSGEGTCAVLLFAAA